MKITIVFGGRDDWVDKTGAFRLAALYPSKIDVKIIE
jgi:hypothetical protein